MIIGNCEKHTLHSSDLLLSINDWGLFSYCEFCMLLCDGCYAGLQVSGMQDVDTQEVCSLHPSRLRGTPGELTCMCIGEPVHFLPNRDNLGYL